MKMLHDLFKAICKLFKNVSPSQVTFSVKFKKFLYVKMTSELGASVSDVKFSSQHSSACFHVPKFMNPRKLIENYYAFIERIVISMGNSNSSADPKLEIDFNWIVMGTLFIDLIGATADITVQYSRDDLDWWYSRSFAEPVNLTLIL